MIFANMFLGSVRVRVTSACVEDTLTKISMASVQIKQINRTEPLCAEFVISQNDISIVSDIASKSGGKFEILGEFGLYWRLLALRRRPILLLGVLLYIFAVCYIPTRVLFVEVEGNKIVSEGMILDQAESAGVRFGVSRKSIRSEQIKNALLTTIPQLQWVGVNTRGCVATVTVKERNEASESKCTSGVCSIVAKCDGIIDSVVVTRGNVLCKPGQAVQRNQVLVSGYTDCGLTIKATKAEAEVYAKTIHDLEVVVPLEQTKRTGIIRTERKFNIIFGKKQIKLYKDSGISGNECVKIYEKNVLSLPGGFELPVAIVKETRIICDAEVSSIEEIVAYEAANQYSRQYLTGNMVAGEIQTASDFARVAEDALHFYGKYTCREMIGKVYEEEIITGDEQRDGANR